MTRLGFASRQPLVDLARVHSVTRAHCIGWYIRPEQSLCFVAARRAGLYVTSAQRAESDAAPFMWCAVRRKSSGGADCGRSLACGPLHCRTWVLYRRRDFSTPPVAVRFTVLPYTDVRGLEVRGSERRPQTAPSTILLEPAFVCFPLMSPFIRPYTNMPTTSVSVCVHRPPSRVKLHD